MKATLLLSLILSSIQANYSLLGNETRIYNISTSLPEVSTNSSTTSNVSTKIPEFSTPYPTIHTTRSPILKIISTIDSIETNNQFQICMSQKAVGRNLNTTKILQENYIPKVSYKMFFGVPNFQYCTINVTLINSIAGRNEKKVPYFYFTNIDKKNCNLSLPEISCNETSLCTKKLVCCDDTKIEEVEGCYTIRTINRCNTIKNTSTCMALTQLNIPINTAVYNPSTVSPWNISTTDNSAETTKAQIVMSILAFIIANILR